MDELDLPLQYIEGKNNGLVDYFSVLLIMNRLVSVQGC